MKKSKIFSVALAAIISAGSVACLTSNAISWHFSGKEDLIANIDEYFSDSEKYLDIKDYKCLRYNSDSIANYMVVDMCTNGGAFYRFKDCCDSINFICSFSDIDLIGDIIKSVDDSLQLSVGLQLHEGLVLKAIARVDKDGNYMEIPAEMAREIYGLLEEYVTRFDYYYDMYSFYNCYCSYFTEYPIENAAVLEECIKRNNIDAEVVTFEGNNKGVMEAEEYLNSEIIGYPDGSAFVVPNKELSLKGHLDLAELIYEDTGLCVEYFIFEDAGETVGNEIDMYNAVDGDANCDGELSIADATLILQHLGNADKYGLSAQGEFNADVTGDYDGISAADALAIQMFETGVIDEFV